MAEGSPASDPAGRPALNLPPIIRFAITGVGNSVVGFAVLLFALKLGFTDLAANAIKEPAAGAARKMADTLVKQTVDATGQALRAAAAQRAAQAATVPIKT